MPESSLEDRDQITDFIQSGLIFPLVSRVEDREAILQGLLSTPGRILSLKTLAQDTLFLDEPAWALRHLFPPFRGVSLQKIMRRHWQLVGAGEVQISEFNYCVIPPDTTNSFGICMLQLWLFALRHFTYRQPRSHISRKGSTEALGLANLALLATRLGFKSGQIEYLRSGNNSRSIAKDFLHSLCSEEFCEIEDSKLQTASRQLHSFLLKVQRLKQEEAIDSVLYTTDDRHDKAKHRFNRPTREQYTQQRKYLFIQHIFGLDQPASQYPTAIGVTRDILLSFFGDEARDILSTRQEAPSSDPRVQNMERNISDDAYSDMAHDSPTEGILDGRQIEYTVSDPLSNEHSNIAPKSPVLEPGSTQKALPDSPSSEYSSHPSNKPTSPRRESEQSIMDFEPHQSGTATPSIPMAPGFEDMLSISRMQVEAPIIPRRSTEEILILWSQSNKDVIVIWKFENRSYHKFSLEGD
ncbi:hypothetical protein N7490_005207 [Penicillium lividum]|nr:hypothetical protein N7490_005207 [Penicillium lividum]